jgi:YidC/Oxa1 family membrane protein insertase
VQAITNTLKAVLDWIYTIISNYGWSIVIFTVLMKAALLPLDIKSRQGMRKMQRIQPELNALQKKYANDKQKLQQKQSELMRKERYNPLSGCLPMLIQMPILFAMFGAMRAIANEQTVVQVFEYLSGTAPVYEGWLWVRNIWSPDSLFATIVPSTNALQMISHDVWQQVFSSLSPEKVELIMQNLAAKAPEFAGTLDFSSADALRSMLPHIISVLGSMPEYVEMLKPVPGWANLNFFITSITLYIHYNGYLILPVLAGLTQVLNTKLNPQTSQQAENQSGSQTSGMTGFMKYFFPLFSVFICLTSNAGFALYWVVSNIVASLSSLGITRYYDRIDKLAAENKGAVSIQ